MGAPLERADELLLVQVLERFQVRRDLLPPRRRIAGHIFALLVTKRARAHERRASIERDKRRLGAPSEEQLDDLLSALLWPVAAHNCEQDVMQQQQRAAAAARWVSSSRDGKQCAQQMFNVTHTDTHTQIEMRESGARSLTAAPP